MHDNDNDSGGKGRESSSPPPAPALSGAPNKDLEKKLRKEPDNLDAKVDVGSDESMDASDPSSAVQPGQNDDPAPSSGFPE